jgi:hypothetical protein
MISAPSEDGIPRAMEAIAATARMTEVKRMMRCDAMQCMMYVIVVVMDFECGEVELQKRKSVGGAN